MPGVRDGVNRRGEGECGYKRITEEILVVMEMFCFFTMSISTSLWSCRLVWQDITVWDKLGKVHRRALYHFLQLHVLNNDLKTKSLMLKNQMAENIQEVENQNIR